MVNTLCVYIAPRPAEYTPAIEHFCESYQATDAGAPHDLLIVCKGDREWASVGEVTHAPDEGFDLGPFQRVCRERRDYEYVMLLATGARFHCDGWLAHYLSAFADDVAMVASTGSYAPGHSGVFPNAHLRTANIMVRPGLVNALELPDAQSKMDCWHIEHGNRSLTRLLRARGHRCLVVGRDGQAFDVDGWPASRTFWRHAQENLIASDAQTDRYAAGDPYVQSTLTAEAWFGGCDDT